MASRDEAVKLLQEGLTLQEIASRKGISMSSVIQYLNTTIGEGKIRRSDLLFAIPKEKRTFFEQLIQKHRTVHSGELRVRSYKEGRNLDADREILDLYLHLRDARVVMGDMYEALRSIELALHSSVRSRLKEEYGDDWWRKGVPQAVRKSCVTTKEDDPEPIDDPFCYTTLIHLRAVIDEQWKILAGIFPRELSANKQALMASLNKLNQIRNGVMHPVKGIVLSEDEFEFVRTFLRVLGKTIEAADPRKAKRGIPMAEFMAETE